MTVITVLIFRTIVHILRRSGIAAEPSFFVAAWAGAGAAWVKMIQLHNTGEGATMTR